MSGASTTKLIQTPVSGKQRDYQRPVGPTALHLFAERSVTSVRETSGGESFVAMRHRSATLGATAPSFLPVTDPQSPGRQTWEDL